MRATRAALLLGALVWSGVAFADERSYEASFAYFGETYTHPGARLGLSTAFVEKGAHRFSGGLGLGGYYHARNSTSLFTALELGYRCTSGFGLYVELTAFAGYLHSFVDGAIYELRDGALQKAANVGRPFFMPGGSLGLGFDFKRVRGRFPVAVFLKQFAFGQYPLDHQWVPNIGVEMGIALSFPFRKEALP